MLASLAAHPNAGVSVLVVGLGCENNQLQAMLHDPQTSTTVAGYAQFANARPQGSEVAEGVRWSRSSPNSWQQDYFDAATLAISAAGTEVRREN